MRRVLFAGLGSAGQRHLRNLIRILDGNIEVMAYRYHKSERVFDDICIWNMLSKQPNRVWICSLRNQSQYLK